MIKKENCLGTVELSYNYLSKLVLYASSGCFGVADLNPADRLHSFFSFLRNGAYNDGGVALEVIDGKLYIGLHITVLYGTNVSAVADNLAQKVRYTLKEKTGLKIGKITVFVDNIRA